MLPKTKEILVVTLSIGALAFINLFYEPHVYRIPIKCTTDIVALLSKEFFFFSRSVYCMYGP